MKSSGGIGSALLACGLLLALSMAAYFALRPNEAEISEHVRHTAIMNAAAEARAEALIPFEVTALGGGAMIIVTVIAGLGYYTVVLLRKRALTVYPNNHGIFPLVQLHIGGQVVVHDPNRQPVSTTIYSPDGRGGVTVTPITLPQLADATRAAVAQAATVQAIRAGVSSGAGLLPEHVQRVAQSLFPASVAAPQVHIIGDGLPVTQLDRLLASSENADVEQDAN
jgi:hypothetical protein